MNNNCNYQCPAGPPGPKGSTGSRGLTGPKGSAGPRGFTGPKGSTGLKGSTGRDGAPGKRGPAGLNGLKGEKGDSGVSKMPQKMNTTTATTFLPPRSVDRIIIGERIDDHIDGSSRFESSSDSTTTQNEGDFSFGLFHGGNQTENQHPSFTYESQWTQWVSDATSTPMETLPDYGPVNRYRCHIGTYHFATSFYNREKDQATTLCQQKYDCDIVIKWSTTNIHSLQKTGYDIGSTKNSVKCQQNPDMTAEIIWKKN